MKTYKDLIIWQKAFDLAIYIIELTDKFPNSNKVNIISTQLVRAVTSVGANVAEGYGRKQGKEMEQFFQYAIGSANETDYWLNICYGIKLIDKYMFLKLTAVCLEIIKMLNVFIYKSKSHRNSSKSISLSC